MKRGRFFSTVLLLLFVTATFAAAAVTYKEAPMLSAMVAKGTLPAVAKRLPDKPKVVESIEATGKYGGELRMFATGIGIWDMWGQALFRIPRSGAGIEPDLCEDYNISSDKKVLTVYLRKNLKWSDGFPFTSEDIKFMYMDMIWHSSKGVRNWGSLPQFRDVQMIDDYTVRMATPNGVGTGPLEMAGWQGSQTQSFSPAHYLKKWHIDYNPDAEKIAKADKFDTWQASMQSHYWWSPMNDLNCPQINPWIIKEKGVTQKIYERNPYFWRVDSAGNQLPYLDRIVVSIVDQEVYQLKIISGDSDLAYQSMKLDNIDLFKTNEKSGNYRTILFPGAMSSAYTLIVNQNLADPVLKPVFSNIKFKQGISVAINRAEINKVVLFGLGQPGQASPLTSASFYNANFYNGKGWRDYYAQYDLVFANKLLDEAGLNKRDSNGFRIGPDGKVFSLVVEYSDVRCTPVLELIKEYWNAVGLQTTMKLEDAGLMDTRNTASQIQIWMHTNANIPPSAERFAFMSLWQWTPYNTAWSNWERPKQEAVRKMLGSDEVPLEWMYMKTPDDNNLPGATAGYEEPPDEYKAILRLQNIWRSTDVGSPLYVETGRKVFDYHMATLDRIGTVGEVPNVMLASNRLGNVLKPNWVKGIPLDDGLFVQYFDQLYIK